MSFIQPRALLRAIASSITGSDGRGEFYAAAGEEILEVEPGALPEGSSDPVRYAKLVYHLVTSVASLIPIPSVDGEEAQIAAEKFRAAEGLVDVGFTIEEIAEVLGVEPHEVPISYQFSPRHNERKSGRRTANVSHSGPCARRKMSVTSRGDATVGGDRRKRLRRVSSRQTNTVYPRYFCCVCAETCPCLQMDKA